MPLELPSAPLSSHSQATSKHAEYPATAVEEFA